MEFKKGDKVRVINIEKLRRGNNIEGQLFDRMDVLKSELATIANPGSPPRIRFDCGLSGLIMEYLIEFVPDLDIENEAYLDRPALNEAFAAILS